MPNSNGPINQEIIYHKLNNRVRGIMDQHTYRKTAVLIPLIYTKDHHLAVVFERRSSRLRTQPGEISFPGGHREPDDQDEWITAQRETSEELQIPMDCIEYFGELDVLFTQGQIIIYPYVGMLNYSKEMIPNPEEVEELIIIELETLLHTNPQIFEVSLRVEPDEDFPFHLIPKGKNYPWRTYQNREGSSIIL